MNWIIGNTSRFKYHTDIKELFKDNWIDISQYNWVLSNLDYMYWGSENIAINLDERYFILNPDDFANLVSKDIQFIWAVIIAVPINFKITFPDVLPPFADGNDLIWENENFQIENATIEISAWDSSYTIIKFKEKSLSNTFKANFDEAIPLDEYKF